MNILFDEFKYIDSDGVEATYYLENDCDGWVFVSYDSGARVVGTKPASTAQQACTEAIKVFV